MSAFHWSDTLRVVVFAQFFLLLGQALAVILLYHRARTALRRAHPSAQTKAAGLLPLHVLLVTVVFLGLAAESVLRTKMAITHGVNWWLVANLLLLGGGNYALWAVMRFEHTRVREAREILISVDAGLLSVDEGSGDVTHSS